MTYQIRPIERIERRVLKPRDGFDLDAVLIPDYDTQPTDYDGPHASGIGVTWDYVGLVVTASRGGIELGQASLWGCEHGTSTDWTGEASAFDNGHLPDLTNDALIDARAAVARICGTVTA